MSSTTNTDAAICVECYAETLGNNWRFIAETVTYRRPAVWPDSVEVRFGTKHVGNSSVEYKVGMFNTNGQLLADGKFVHVYVSKDGRPHKIPDVSRRLLDSLAIASQPAEEQQ